MSNLIPNYSFENGWTDRLYGWTKNQVPNQWELRWWDLGEVYRDEPIKSIAEHVHKLQHQLPPAEHPGGADPLILDGTTVYKIFSSGGSFASRLSQTLTGLIPEEPVRISVPVRAHHQDRDPYGIEVSVRANDSFVWKNTPTLPNRTWVLLELVTETTEYGEIELEITFDTKWQIPVDYFIDNLQLSYIDEDIPEAPPKEPPIVVPPTPEEWRFDRLPTHFPIIWYPYGIGHEDIDYGGGQHCGTDWKSGYYGEIINVSRGVVTSVLYDNVGFGHHVIVSHNERYSTLYAHMSKIYVTVGMEIEVGFVLGLSGMTGNVVGPEQHLHHAVIDYVDPDPNCYNRYVDAEPFYRHLIEGGPPEQPLPPTGIARDLAPYFCPDVPYGPIFRVQHASGPQEMFQVQSAFNFKLVKNHLFEELRFDDNHIWRGLDISPGPAPDYAERPGNDRYYIQSEPGDTMAKWCKRHMVAGEFFNGPGHDVKFYYKDNCQSSSANSGRATNNVQFVKHHPQWPINGHSLDDVIELFDGHERFFFMLNVGMVGWTSPWGVSGFWEWLPGHANLSPEKGCWD